MACVWSGEAGWTCTGWTGWVTWSTMLSERRWENRLHINMKVVVGRRLIFYLRHIQFPFTLPLVQLHFLLLWCRSVPTTAVADRETSLMSCPPPSPRPPLCVLQHEDALAQAAFEEARRRTRDFEDRDRSHREDMEVRGMWTNTYHSDIRPDRYC